MSLPPAPPPGLYCTLEVDSFGYFVNKAKTRVYRDTAEPNWNEVGGSSAGYAPKQLNFQALPSCLVPSLGEGVVVRVQMDLRNPPLHYNFIFLKPFSS